VFYRGRASSTGKPISSKLAAPPNESLYRQTKNLGAPAGGFGANARHLYKGAARPASEALTRRGTDEPRAAYMIRSKRGAVTTLLA
jgi:hypothetical protein